ncbi:MAG: hypothetical protein LWW85_09395 [Marinilabiliales bacterium]|nr:hypothetical protein [Marinilabiliales bacterium]
MKKNIYLLLVVLLWMYQTPLKAQKSESFPRLRERMMQAKWRAVSQQLELDAPTLLRFKPVYLSYEMEMAAVDFRQQARIMRVNADSLSADEARLLIENQIRVTKKILEIREKYYHEFLKVLPPQKIIRLYQAEGEIRNRINAEVRRRFGKL